LPIARLFVGANRAGPARAVKLAAGAEAAGVGEAVVMARRVGRTGAAVVPASGLGGRVALQAGRDRLQDL
jgi:hypothetical protein